MDPTNHPFVFFPSTRECPLRTVRWVPGTGSRGFRWATGMWGRTMDTGRVGLRRPPGTWALRLVRLAAGARTACTAALPPALAAVCPGRFPGVRLPSLPSTKRPPGWGRMLHGRPAGVASPP